MLSMEGLFEAGQALAEAAATRSCFLFCVGCGGGLSLSLGTRGYLRAVTGHGAGLWARGRVSGHWEPGSLLPRPRIRSQGRGWRGDVPLVQPGALSCGALLGVRFTMKVEGRGLLKGRGLWKDLPSLPEQSGSTGAIVGVPRFSLAWTKSFWSVCLQKCFHH